MVANFPGKFFLNLKNPRPWDVRHIRIMVLSHYCIKQLRDFKSYMPKTTSLGLGCVWAVGLGMRKADGFGVKLIPRCHSMYGISGVLALCDFFLVAYGKS